MEYMKTQNLGFSCIEGGKISYFKSRINRKIFHKTLFKAHKRKKDIKKGIF